MHFWRVKPMEPTARPRSAAISAYGARGSFEEKKFDKAAALRRESSHGFAQHLFFLGLLHKSFGDGGRFGFGKVGVSVAADQALLLLLVTKALVVSDLHEPFGKGARLAQFGETIQQFDASGLKDVGGFVGRQSVFDGDRIDECFVLFDEERPGFFVAGEAFLHETLIAPKRGAFFATFVLVITGVIWRHSPRRCGNRVARRSRGAYGSRTAGWILAMEFFAPTRMSGLARKIMG